MRQGAIFNSEKKDRGTRPEFNIRINAISVNPATINDAPNLWSFISDIGKRIGTTVKLGRVRPTGLDAPPENKITRGIIDDSL